MALRDLDANSFVQTVATVIKERFLLVFNFLLLLFVWVLQHDGKLGA
jgi:hypothetical protein